MKCERKSLDFFLFFFVVDLSFLTLEFFFLKLSCVCLFVCLCALLRIRTLSLIRDSYYIYTERKKIHECSSRGEGKKDEDKERKE